MKRQIVTMPYEAPEVEAMDFGLDYLCAVETSGEGENPGEVDW